MASLFKKDNAAMPVDAPIAADANAPEAEAPKAKKEKKNKQQYLEQHKMNFLEQYEIVVEGKKKNLDLQKIMKPLIAVGIVVLAVFVILEVVLLGMKAQTKSLNKYINDETNVATYNEAVETKTETDTVNTQAANLQATIDAIASYPHVGVNFFTKTNNVATSNSVTITSYSYITQDGTLTVSCTATTPDNISQFVRDMKSCGLFLNVVYNAFSGNADGDTYSFSVQCTCNNEEVEDVTPVATTTEATTEG